MALAGKITAIRPLQVLRNMGRVFFIVRGEAGDIYWKESTDEEWTYLGGLTEPGSGVSAVLKGNILHVAVQGTDGGLYYATVNVDTKKTVQGFTYIPGGYAKPQTFAVA
jgi:hypothetical protein